MRTHLFSLFFCATLFAQNDTTFSLSRLNSWQASFVSEQKQLINKSLFSSTFSPPLGRLGYAPIVITNSTSFSDDSIYVLSTGQELTGATIYFLQPDPATGICSFASASDHNSADSSISVQLSSLPAAGNHSYYFYVPQTAGGRTYLSINTPLFLQTSLDGLTINSPSQATTQDPNYYTIYQNFEFTFDSGYDLYVNVTYVDYFSMPFTLSSYSATTGNLYPTLDNLTVVGFPATSSRSSLLTSIESGLSAYSEAPTSWSVLTIPFYLDPYSATSSVATDLRVLSPKQSVAYGGTGYQFQGAGQAQGFIPLSYATDTVHGPVSGLSYNEALWSSLNTAGSVTMTVYPQSEPATTYTMATNGSNTLQLTSTDSGADTPIAINLKNLTVQDLFGGAIGDWYNSGSGAIDSDSVYAVEIVKTLSALYNAGFLPPPSTLAQPIISQSSYFSAYRSSYFSNPTGYSLNGPWYDLYDSVIHPLLVQTDHFGLGYAYDYDDLLDLGGLLHVNMQSNGILNSYQPYALLTADPIDTPIPNPKESFGPYTLNISARDASHSYPVNILYSTTSADHLDGTYSVSTTSGGAVTAYDYFLVQCFMQNNTTGPSVTYIVYPKYQLILPYSSPTRYNTTDAALMNGLTFTGTTDASAIFINIPATANIFP